MERHPIPGEDGGSMQKGWPIGSERPESFQVAKQAEQSAEGPAPQGGRVRGAIRILGWRNRLLPTAFAAARRFPGLLSARKAVLAAGRRPVGQNGESQSTQPAQPAADPNPVVAFVVGLLAPSAVADDGVSAASRTPSREQRQWEHVHPGALLSCGSGSAIKRITAGVKARR